MIPQYVATQSSCTDLFEASTSQSKAMGACGYLFARCSSNLALRFTQVTYTSRGTGPRDIPVGLFHNNDRRLRCPRASNCWQYLALHSLRPLAHVAHRLKSSLWLIPRRSPSSQHTQVSTSNLAARQAFAPASTLTLTHLTGGASWH